MSFETDAAGVLWGPEESQGRTEKEPLKERAAEIILGRESGREFLSRSRDGGSCSNWEMPRRCPEGMLMCPPEERRVRVFQRMRSKEVGNLSADDRLPAAPTEGPRGTCLLRPRRRGGRE